MQKELRNKRINVRATDSMVDRLKGIKAYLNSYSYISLSDSEVLEVLLDYVLEMNDLKDLHMFLSDRDNWEKFSSKSKNLRH